MDAIVKLPSWTLIDGASCILLVTAIGTRLQSSSINRDAMPARLLAQQHRSEASQAPCSACGDGGRPQRGGFWLQFAQ